MTRTGAASDHARELALTLHLCDLADAISMERFRALDLSIERKPDMSPVTEADTRIETTLREVIGRERPDDAIAGEELGETGAADAEWRWVIDPIDGTKRFVRGNETWATLIALQHRGATVVAVASMPAFGHRYTATRGAGSFLNGERLHVSAADSIGAATLAHTSLSGFTWAGLDGKLTALARACWDARGFGNALSHLAVARGTADIGWTSRASEWDYAALALIVEEAGGRFSDLDDRPAIGGSGISTNGVLHPDVLEYIARIS